MSNCKILTKKFKEFSLADQNGNLTPDNQTHNHDTPNEMFLVGYKYQSEASCPEIKMRLADIVSGSGGSGSSIIEDGGLLDYLKRRTDVSFTENENIGYGLWAWDDDEDQYNLSLFLPKLIKNVSVSYDATTTAYGQIDRPNETLELHLLPNGGGGGGTLPIHDVLVYQNASESTGSYENGTLTLNLVPGEQGPQGPQGVPGQNGQDGQDGQDGIDGATIDMYKVGFIISGSSKGTPAQGVTENEMPYVLSPSNITWSKFDPSTGQYTGINSAPLIETGEVVEIGLPDTTNPVEIARNLRYGVFGIYQNSTFNFYSVERIISDTPIVLSVKVYKNSSFDSNSNNL